jgi:cell division protease FtsH
MAQGGETRKFRPSLVYIVLAFWAVLLVQQVVTSYLQPERMPYSEFRAAVTLGLVRDAAIGETIIRGHVGPPVQSGTATGNTAPPPGKDPAGKDKETPPPAKGQGAPTGVKPFETVRVEDPDLLRELQKHDVKVTGIVESRFMGGALAWLLPLAVMIAVWVLVMRRLGGAAGQNGFMAIGRSKAKIYMEKDVKVTFADVAGVDEAKDELREVIDFLKTPERFGRLGAKLPKGVMLVGPPGTGKTLLARAVAGEAGVPFFSISGSDFVEMFVGVGASRVRDLFEQAKQKAPCIVFIDELDALGKARGVGPVTHEEREQTLNQLLVELDGFDARLAVILVAATNRPEILDPALLRAGRFDRHVLVDRPDKADRLAILRLHARKVPMEADDGLDFIAGMTAGFVGADLANIINEAALLGVRREKKLVGRAELQEAVERIIAGLEKKNRVLSPREKARVAHHELGHALAALAIPGMDGVQKISIIPRGIAALGYTLQVPTEDRFLMTESELEDKVAVLLGGRVAEELIYGEVSTGAHDDLTKATDIARSMVKSYGMSPRLGRVSLDKDRRGLFLQTPGAEGPARGDYSEATARGIDDEVRRIIDEQHERVTELLGARRTLLARAAGVLLAKETITGDELRALIEREGLDVVPDNAGGDAGDGSREDPDDMRRLLSAAERGVTLT